MKMKYMVFMFLLVVLLSTPRSGLLGAAVCNDRESKALLTFKQDLNDTTYNSLSSWINGTDCCSWDGVFCNNNIESNVVKLHLGIYGLSGELNPSLLELKYLNHLDLSNNDFSRKPLPAFLGSLQNLRYLDLSNSDFAVIDGLEWLSNLSSLQYLDMRMLDLSKASSNSFHSISMLPSLLELHLSDCQLDSIPSLSYVNFTSLEILDLSWNKISSSFPNWLSNLTSLKRLDLRENSFLGTISIAVGGLTSLTELDLSVNKFEGTIPIAFGGLTALTSLHLNDNEFEGKVPGTLGNLCNLQRLDLSRNKFNGELSEFFQNSSGCIKDSLNSLDLGYNQISGSVPSSFGCYSLLHNLDLSNNKLNGSLPKSLGLLSKLHTLYLSDDTFESIDEFFFVNLTNLRSLHMDSVVLNLRPDWIPPFQLEEVYLSNCHLGPRFPEWLRTQKQIHILDLSYNGLSGTVPIWFWNMSSQLSFLNLTHNHLSGELPYLSINGGIFLSSNMFKGHLPLISHYVTELDLSYNLFSGPISLLLCNMANNMRLRFLNLSGNLLSKGLPECWSNWKSLRYVFLGSNSITGKIPNSMGSLIELQSLHLRNNSMSGELPLSLRNCTNLVTIDLGENGFTGSIPKWMGQSLTELSFLRLRSNKFTGGIPEEFCHLNSLQLLDLAYNNLSGTIPRCFNNFSAMALKQNISALPFFVNSTSTVTESASVVTKGKEREYSNTLLLFTSMDLSKNNLSGQIPAELTNLLTLRSFNLSYNQFTGKIPEKISRMSLLESLDFSNNKLSGLIPQSMTNLTFLGHLNLSFNNLSGEIPSSTQLQSFSEGYMSNPELCGLPLKRCNGDEQPRHAHHDDENAEEHGPHGNEGWIEME